jgi:hypothetical protein
LAASLTVYETVVKVVKSLANLPVAMSLASLRRANSTAYRDGFAPRQSWFRPLKRYGVPQLTKSQTQFIPSEMLNPYDAGEMRRYAVSARVNSATNDDRQCSEPIEGLGAMQAGLF